MDAASTGRSDAVLSAVEFARAQPAKLLAIVIAVHLVVWTILPILVSPNLQLDLAEGLALGKEWQLGYWKHPPLPWWVTDLIFRIVGHVNAVYVLGPLAVAVCMIAVWLLARDIVGPVQALIAVLALEGIHFYNFSAVKFAHDQMQLPVWALAALFFYRALVHGRAHHWMLTGAMVALAFWTKYSAVPFAASLGLFLLFDPVARRTWRTPGPYLAALVFAVVLAPHVYWLFNNQEIAPFIYANARARVAEHWYEYLEFPLRWIGSQFFFVLPALGLLALAYFPRATIVPAAGPQADFARRTVTMLAFGPFLFVTVTALVLGRLPILLWGYPLYTFIPLAAIVWFGPVTDIVRQRSFAAGFVILFVAMLVLYAGVQLLEPLVSQRTRATDFPGQALSERLTQIWREKFNAPLAYVTGDDLAANNVAAYSPDHPHVVTHGMAWRAAWIDMNDVRRRGIVILWTEAGRGEIFLDFWKSQFPGFADSSVIELPLQTWRTRPPLRIRYAIVPPRP